VLRTERLRDEATPVAGRASSTFFAVIGIAALAVAVVAAMPAEAKKRQNSAKPIEEPIPDIANGEPMTLVVSLSNQKVDVYRGTTLITSSAVSTGMPGHATKMGVFSILEKQRYHHSNIYSGAPMPWMNRITWSGTALHAGVVPGYPASHGCIRLPFSFAPKLFQITTKGDNVIVSRDRLAPQGGGRPRDPQRPSDRPAARRPHRAQGSDRPRGPRHHRRLEGLGRPRLPGHRHARRAGHRYSVSPGLVVLVTGPSLCSISS